MITDVYGLESIEEVYVLDYTFNGLLGIGKKYSTKVKLNNGKYGTLFNKNCLCWFENKSGLPKGVGGDYVSISGKELVDTYPILGTPSETTNIIHYYGSLEEYKKELQKIIIAEELEL